MNFMVAIVSSFIVVNAKTTCSDTSQCKFSGCDLSICREGICYTGTRDARCNKKKNGTDLKDGGWCWDKRRDIHCPARPSANSI